MDVQIVANPVATFGVALYRYRSGAKRLDGRVEEVAGDVDDQRGV